MSITTKLPYSFDLLWDIKTLEQLKIEYQKAKEFIQDVDELCLTHNIDLENK